MTDRMISPTSGENLMVDERLLLKSAWLETPTEIARLLVELAGLPNNSGLSLLAKTYMATLESDFITNSEVAPPDADCILIMGNALNKDASPSTELLARLAAALEVSSVNPAAQIIVSGDGEILGIKECALMKRWLVERGVPSSSIIEEDESNDSVQNLLFSTKIIAEIGAKKVVLVTGAAHIFRAFRLLDAYCRQQGLATQLLYFSPNSANAEASDAAARSEEFLCFKDLGRILGIWDYAEWKLPSPGPGRDQELVDSTNDQAQPCSS